MFTIAVGNSLVIHSIMLPSNSTNLPSTSFGPLSKINMVMKMHAVNLVEKGLGQVGKHLYGAKVTVMGLAYKKNINDPRESPSIKIIEELVRLGAKVRVYDPYVSSLQTLAGEFLSAASIEDALDCAECAIFLTEHDVFRQVSLKTMKEMMASPIIVDGKNMFDGGEGIVYLGIGKRTYDFGPNSANNQSNSNN